MSDETEETQEEQENEENEETGEVEEQEENEEQNDGGQTELATVGSDEPAEDDEESGGTEVMPDQKEEAQERTQRVRDLSQKENEIFIRLAEELYEIREGALFQYVDNPDTGEPYKSMGEYIDNEVKNAGQRKASYMMSIWEYYVVEHSEEFLEEVKQVGWTKLAELEDIITPDNKEEWLEKANKLGVRDLKQEIKQLESDDDDTGSEPGPDDVGTSQTERMTFELFEDQEDTINKALNLAQDMKPDSDNKSDLLELICADFIAANQGGGSPADSLKRIENSLGIDIVAFKESGIIYGGDTIDRIAESAKERKQQSQDEEEVVEVEGTEA